MRERNTKCLTAGKALRVWRAVHDQNQADVAAAVSTSLTTISRIEKGGRPSGPLAAAIERLTGGEIPAGWWFDANLGPDEGEAA